MSIGIGPLFSGNNLESSNGARPFQSPVGDLKYSGVMTALPPGAPSFDAVGRTNDAQIGACCTCDWWVYAPGPGPSFWCQYFKTQPCPTTDG